MVLSFIVLLNIYNKYSRLRKNSTMKSSSQDTDNRIALSHQRRQWLRCTEDRHTLRLGWCERCRQCSLGVSAGGLGMFHLLLQGEIIKNLLYSSWSGKKSIILMPKILFFSMCFSLEFYILLLKSVIWHNIRKPADRTSSSKIVPSDQVSSSMCSI